MPRNLVPILVKLGRNVAGKFDWPDFDAVDPAIRGGMHWTHFVDAFGLGWKYPRELTPEEAEANIRCVAGTLVPPDFAAAAVAAFPERIEILDEVEWADFFEQRVQPPGRDELLDVQELQSLAALAQLDQFGLLDAPGQGGAHETPRRRDQSGRSRPRHPREPEPHLGADKGAAGRRGGWREGGRAEGIA